MQCRRAALVGAVGLTMTLVAGRGSVGGGTAGSSNAPAGGTTQDPKDMTMVNVVKVKGIAWFDRMAVGDQNFAKRTGVDTRQEGADDTSPEKQIQIIQDLIPQHPTAITVVPNSPEALQNVLCQARAQGIKVVTHEATGIQNADIDIEAFDNAAYGKQIMQNLAQCMGQQGKYVQFVGGLTGMYPNARFKLDVNGMIDEYAQRAGMPAKLIRTTEDAEADADAEQQAQQNAQAAESAAKLGKPVKDVTDAAQLAAQLPVASVPAIQDLTGQQ